MARTAAKAGGARALVAARVAKRKAAQGRRSPRLAKKATKAEIYSYVPIDEHMFLKKT